MTSKTWDRYWPGAKLPLAVAAVLIGFGIIANRYPDDAYPSLMGGTSALLILAGAVGLYFLPSIIGRKKRNSTAIFTLNLFLGWTFVGWVVAMVWAVTKEPYVA